MYLCLDIPTVASIAPLNTSPMPTSAFNMVQSLPPQPLSTSVVFAPMTEIHTAVPPVGSINIGIYAKQYYYYLYNIIKYSFILITMLILLIYLPFFL